MIETNTAIDIISNAGYDVYLKEKNTYILYDTSNMDTHAKTYTKDELVDFATELLKLS